jgi:hypothetical protein
MSTPTTEKLLFDILYVAPSYLPALINGDMSGIDASTEERIEELTLSIVNSIEIRTGGWFEYELEPQDETILERCMITGMYCQCSIVDVMLEIPEFPSAQ